MAMSDSRAHEPQGQTTDLTSLQLPTPTNRFGKTWKQAEGLPETVAPLECLPAGVYFGEDFPEPISYDPQRKVLRYRGQMFHGNFTFLSSMSRDVKFYQALETLFVKSTKATPAKRWWLW
jgi:hypothetical protein